MRSGLSIPKTFHFVACSLQRLFEYSDAGPGMSLFKFKYDLKNICEV